MLVPGLPWFRASNPLRAPGLRAYLGATRPSGAVDYMCRCGLQGLLFCRLEWGGSLEWELWPRVAPLLDARIEIRPESVWRDYFLILGADARWQERLDQYDVNAVLLERATFPDLVREMSASPRWREV